MKVNGDVTVQLPFTLDFCAKGPDVDPLPFSMSGFDGLIFFPPSMSEGTVGQSFFSSGWAWWTGTSLRLKLSQDISESSFHIADTRRNLLEMANLALRYFLNKYRILFHRPDVHPVLVNPKDLELTIEFDDGRIEDLPEPIEAFFYQSIPDNAPLESSINSTTIPNLTDFVSSNSVPLIREHLLLDAEWLEVLGEKERAGVIKLAAKDITSSLKK
jgi:hypothetical protein